MRRASLLAYDVVPAKSIFSWRRRGVHLKSFRDEITGCPAVRIVISDQNRYRTAGNGRTVRARHRHAELPWGFRAHDRHRELAGGPAAKSAWHADGAGASPAGAVFRAGEQRAEGPAAGRSLYWTEAIHFLGTADSCVAVKSICDPTLILPAHPLVTLWQDIPLNGGDIVGTTTRSTTYDGPSRGQSPHYHFLTAMRRIPKPRNKVHKLVCWEGCIYAVPFLVQRSTAHTQGAENRQAKYVFDLACPEGVSLGSTVRAVSRTSKSRAGW